MNHQPCPPRPRFGRDTEHTQHPCEISKASPELPLRRPRNSPYRVHKPEGAFFVWLWFPNLPITSQQLYERLKQRHVLVVPGHYFFPGLTEPWSHTNKCIRVNYAQDHKVVSARIQVIADEVCRV